jgi:hypothetical protein
MVGLCSPPVRLDSPDLLFLKDGALIFLAFVVPLAIYLATLARINRSPHPIMISGRWDFVGVLFASSGILLVGGPAILTGLYDQWRLAWILGQVRFLHEVGDSWYFWLAIWGVYFVVVIAWAAHYLYHRGNLTSVYNVDPPVLLEVLKHVLENQGIETLANHGNRLVISPRGIGRAFSFVGPAASQSGVEVGIDPFPAMKHVTLRWPADSSGLQTRVESALARVLPEVETPPHMVGSWLMSIAITLFMVGGLIALVVVGLRAATMLN